MFKEASGSAKRMYRAVSLNPTADDGSYKQSNL